MSPRLRLLPAVLVACTSVAMAQLPPPPPGGAPPGPPRHAPPPGMHPPPHPHGAIPPPPPETRVVVVEVPVIVQAAPAPPAAQPIAAPAAEIGAIPAEVASLPATSDAAPAAPVPTDAPPVRPTEAAPAATLAASPAPAPAPVQDASEAAAGAVAPSWTMRLGAILGVVALLAWLATWLRARALAAHSASLSQAQRELRSRHMRLREESEHLRQLATNDPLTGTLNRQAFGQALRERVATVAPFRRPLSLVVFDLDHFKQINDRDGHLAGDAALRLVAGIVRECLDSDDLFGRFGGDEFLIALSDQSADDVAAIAERIRSLVEVRALGHQPPLTGLSVSMGIAHAAATDDYDGDLLFHRADVALYVAKRRGRNRVVVADTALVDGVDATATGDATRHL